jgi:hypothetical protein
MSRSRTLSIEIVGDAKGLSKAFGEAERKADGFGAKVGKGAGIAAVGVASVGVAALGAAAIFGPAILKMGGQLEAMGVKSKTVFGDSVGDVEAWAESNAKAMGLTNEQLVGAAASFGDLVKPMGFTADEAARMSTEALDLAGALSAWTGGQRSAAEVSDILAKAMLGEREELKSLGISISAADVQQRLYEKGQQDLTGAALQQAEALATQELILEKSTDAQKAWNDGSMDGIKAQNEMKASIGNLQQSLVEALYPAMQAIVPVVTEVATWLGENLPVAMAAVKEWVDENWPKIRDGIVTALEYVKGYVDGFVTTVTALWEQHGDRIMTVVKAAFDFFKGYVENILQVVRGVMDVVMGLIRGDWSEVWNGIKSIFGGVWDQIVNTLRYALRLIGMALDIAWETAKGIFSDAWESIKETVSSGIDAVVGFAKALPGRMVGIFSGMWDGIKTAFKSVINWVIRAWNGLEFSVPGVSAFGKTIGGFTIGVPDIPTLHSGGFAGGPTFAGMADDEVAAILRRGEVVLTPGQAAATARGGGNTFVFSPNVPPNVDMIELGRVFVEAVGQFEQVAGSSWRAA